MAYTVTVKDCSKQLSAIERVALKVSSDVMQIKALVREHGDVTIRPDYYATLSIHNDKSKGETDYEQFIIVDKQGLKYSTTSESLKESFMDIFNDLKDENIDYGIRIFGMPSKNYVGENFLTCTVVEIQSE